MKKAKKKLSKAEIKRQFVALLNSCVEGHNQDWDCTTDEGREGFIAMHDSLLELAKHFGVDVSSAKDQDSPSDIG